jgi:NAD(P)-dependent dehydrogenase (short-subunit alcohol dehydrogenase family)
VDILVNNAGMQHVESVLSFPPAQWNTMLAVNLSAPFHTIQACTPAMLERGWGRIINMASVSGLVGVAHKPAYVASKHGLLGLTKSVALELATTPVTCNAICPGWVLTPLVQAQIEALAQREQLDEAAARQAAGRQAALAGLCDGGAGGGAGRLSGQRQRRPGAWCTVEYGRRLYRRMNPAHASHRSMADSAQQTALQPVFIQIV